MAAGTLHSAVAAIPPLSSANKKRKLKSSIPADFGADGARLSICGSIP